MSKKAIGWWDNNHWDKHVRVDIDNPNSGFTNLGEGKYAQVLLGTKVVRIYYVLTDDETKADTVGDAFAEMNKLAGRTRLPLSQA